jgi:hypothetical protein
MELLNKVNKTLFFSNEKPIKEHIPYFKVKIEVQIFKKDDIEYYLLQLDYYFNEGATVGIDNIISIRNSLHPLKINLSYNLKSNWSTCYGLIQKNEISENMINLILSDDDTIAQKINYIHPQTYRSRLLIALTYLTIC